ncbi:substrate-binding domain-containing protein [Roseimicrobium gellanilyticum]|nr:substrate-binding domain-containing protein [Roseimicrobium gellanilyticum]
MLPIVPAIQSRPAGGQTVGGLLFLCLMLLISPSCKPKDPMEQYGAPPSREKDGRVKVAILADTVEIPLRNYQCALLERLARTRPGMAVMRYGAGGSAAEQARQVRDAQAEGAKFIVIFPLQESVVAPALRGAIAGGVQVIAMSAQLPEDAFTASISCDERRLGAMAADFIVQALRTKASDEGKPVPVGRVVQLRGDEGSASSERALGFSEALQREPGVVLVHDAPAQWNDKDAAARIQEALRLQKQFDVVYAHNDLMASGAAKQLRETSVETRESILVLGTDAVPGADGGASLVNKSVLDATIYHPPLVDVAWRDIERVLDDASQTLKKHQRVKPILITPSNAANFERQSLPKPQTE